ncbi:MAG: cobaltochelatase subunit CobN, partial [Planctomycetota bacterium]
MKNGSKVLHVLACCCMIGLGIASAQEQHPSIGFLGIWDRSAPLIEKASRESRIAAVVLKMEDLLPGAEVKNQDRVLQPLKVLFILNLQPQEVLSFRDTLARVKDQNPELQVIPLDSRDSQITLKRAGLLQEDEKVPLYWRSNGLVNMRRLLEYTAVTYLGAKGEIEAPVMMPDYGFYYPGIEDALPDFDLFRMKTGWKDQAPVIALLIQQSFWITGDTKVIDEQIKALEAEGFNVVTIFGDRGSMISKMLFAVKPDLIVEDRHGSMWEGEEDETVLKKLDAPYLRPISMLRYTLDEWMDDPGGLSCSDRSLFMSIQEPKGTIEPVVVGGLKIGIMGFRLHEFLPERITHFAQRAASWSRLRDKPVESKRVAIIYYNESLGKGDLMRGSPTGGFLDGPESLIRFLPRLKERGYVLDKLPRDARELINRILERGRNIAPWAMKELEAMADLPGAVLIPAERYQDWFDSRLSKKNREAVIEQFGPPPGKRMVVTRNKKPFIVLPAFELGNVLLAAQPERGECQDETLLHSRDVPPPHNYLAFYWWLQEEYKPDAVIHWGTHGSLELLPGKEAGLCADDWSDLCIGTLPVINLWIMDNIGEATLSRRRSYAVLVDHLPPPAVTSGLNEELRNVHDDIDKFESLEPGLLKETFRKRISRAVCETRVHETLELNSLNDRTLIDEEMSKVAQYLHALSNEQTPTNLHILGAPPPSPLLASYLVSILRKPFLDRLGIVLHIPEDMDRSKEERYARLREAGESLIVRTVLGNEEPPAGLEEDILFARDIYSRLMQADNEIKNLLEALDGRYIEPGPGPDPIRNPSSLPSGRNLYALNPEEIPTRPSWDVAVQLVDEMLVKKHPKKVGFDLNGMNTMRDFGVLEAQILYLIGVKPVWDQNHLVIDVELIPRDQLNRPRIDVFIAMGGQYKENFPSRIRLIDKALRLVNSLDESDNLVRQNTLGMEERLLAMGYSGLKAGLLSPARIFGTKPGNMSGTNILHLVPRSGVWENADEITSVYIDSMNYVYTGEIWGEKAADLYGQAIQQTDTLIRAWSSNMTSPLSNHHAYEYLGGLSLAVTQLTGQEPDALIADVRDPDGAKIRDFEEVLAGNLRSELLNHHWISGMMAHDYAGAGHMAELVKNTFGWDVTRSSSVSEGVWNNIYETYVKDKYDMDLHAWFDRVNPHALQEIAATLIEATRKVCWHPEAEVLEVICRVYAQSVVEHGPSSGLISGGNDKL